MLTGTLPASQRLQSVANELARPDAAPALARRSRGRQRRGAARLVPWAAGDGRPPPALAGCARRATRRQWCWPMSWPICVAATIGSASSNSSSSVLHWWNPLVWWVRRRLHAVEEQCCDAWVAVGLPGPESRLCRMPAQGGRTIAASLVAARAGQSLSAHLHTERENRDGSEKPLAAHGVAHGGMWLALLAAVVIPAGVQSGQAEMPTVRAQRSPTRHRRKRDASAAATPASEPKDQEQTPADGATKAEAAPVQSVGVEKPIAKDLQPFQGTWTLEPVNRSCGTPIWKRSKKRGSGRFKVRKSPGPAPERRPLSCPSRSIRASRPIRSTSHSSTVRTRGRSAAGSMSLREAISGSVLRNRARTCLGPKRWRCRAPAKPHCSSCKTRTRSRRSARQKPPPPLQIVRTEKPVVTDLWPVQGTFNFENLISEKWTATPEEVRAWQWTIQGQEITWTRPRKENVRLSFTIDPSKSPPQIDLTFLDGPDKGGEVPRSLSGIATRGHDLFSGSGGES